MTPRSASSLVNSFNSSVVLSKSNDCSLSVPFKLLMLSVCEPMTSDSWRLISFSNSKLYWSKEVSEKKTEQWLNNKKKQFLLRCRYAWCYIWKTACYPWIYFMSSSRFYTGQELLPFLFSVCIKGLYWGIYNVI